MPSPSRYGHKREGHPCIEKGINMTVSTLIEMIVEIHEMLLFTGATPGSSLVFNTKVKNYKFIIRVDLLTYSSFFHWCSNNMVRNESEGKLNFGKKRQQIVSTCVQFFCVFLCTIPHQEKL